MHSTSLDIDTSGPDVAVVRRVLAGERDAYALLVQRHQGALLAALLPLCRSRELAEEVAQAAFVQAYLHLARFNSDATFLPWLKTIALNHWRQEIRRRDTVLRHADRYLDQMRSELPPPAAPERLAALTRCLDQLHPRQRDLLAAVYREQRQLAAIAGERATSVGALKVRLLRLRGFLRDCIARRLAAEGA